MTLPPPDRGIFDPPPTPAFEPPPEHRPGGMWCHLAALSGIVIPFPLIGLAVTFILWHNVRSENHFADDQGKESMNFQITALILFLLCVPLVFCFGLGAFLAGAVGIAALVLVILAAVQSSYGKWHRYPIAIRFIR
jgi:uncharacterized protein